MAAAAAAAFFWFRWAVVEPAGRPGPGLDVGTESVIEGYGPPSFGCAAFGAILPGFVAAELAWV